MNTKELIKKLQAEKRTARGRFYKNPANKEIYGNEDKRPEEFKDKTFLFIRATHSDVGVRPLPAGTVFWNSPDIELYDPTGLVIPTNQLKTGKNFIITVLVHNEGDMACNSCIVELFICNPSIGFDREHATQIGIQTLIVQGHNTVTAHFSFTPATENLGHQCLFARAYSYVTADMPDSANQFYTTTDRHIGQQNLSIISEGTTFEFMVYVPKKLMKQNLSLKLIQNRAPVQDIKLRALSNLKTSEMIVATNRFLIMQNTGPDKTVPLIQNQPANRREKSFFLRLLLFILSIFFRKRFDPSRYQAMTPSGNNTWKKEFQSGPSKVTLEIPYMFLGRNNATRFDIEMTDDKTGISLGGLTLIVKG